MAVRARRAAVGASPYQQACAEAAWALCAWLSGDPAGLSAAERAAFLTFTQDLSLPPGPAFRHPGMTGRLNGATVTQIDGDHEIPLTAPGRLADALHQAATD